MKPDSKSEDRLQHSALQNTEIKKQSFYFKVQQRLNELCIVKQQP